MSRGTITVIRRSPACSAISPSPQVLPRLTRSGQILKFLKDLFYTQLGKGMTLADRVCFHHITIHVFCQVVYVKCSVTGVYRCGLPHSSRCVHLHINTEGPYPATLKRTGLTFGPDIGPRYNSSMMNENHSHTQHQDDSDQSHAPRVFLPPLLLARYKRDLTYRLSRQQKEAERWLSFSPATVLAHALVVVSALVGAALAWRLVSYAIDLGTYVVFTATGDTTEALVLRKRLERSRSVFRGDRYVITYGFWTEDKGTIRRQVVDQEIFDSLALDAYVPVIVLSNPRYARIKSTLDLQWPVDVTVLLGLLALAETGRRLVRRKRTRKSPTGTA